MDIHSICTRFDIREGEKAQLEKSIDRYSRDLSIWNVASKILDTIKSLFGFSDWQKSKRILQSMVFTVVKNHSIVHTPQQELARRQEAVAEFILRYLTTDKSQTIRHSQFLLSAKTMENTRQLPEDEIILRATYSDGKTLGNSPRKSLLDNFHLASQHCETETRFLLAQTQTVSTLGNSLHQDLSQIYELMGVEAPAREENTLAEQAKERAQQTLELLKQLKTAAPEASVRRLSEMRTAVVNLTSGVQQLTQLALRGY